VAYSEFADAFDADFNYLGNNLVATHENTPIAFSPDLIAMSLFQVKPFKNFQVDLISKYVGEQFLDNSGNPERTLHAYFLNDMRFNYTIANAKSWYKSMRIGLQLNNIGNVEYVSNGYTFSYFVDNNLATENFVYPQAGFNFMFLYSIGF
jgi:iron complex outermembrane receptor protein